MTIAQVYQRFNNNQGLQEHQLRVGAIAKTICEHSSQELDETNIVAAALMHDLGNILKFKFDNDDFAALVEPEGVAYWKQRQAEVELEYGAKADEATIAMVAKLELEPEIARVIERAHLEYTDQIIEEDDVSSQVLLYADMRVGPHAITTLEGRIEDIGKRYAHRFTTEYLEELYTKLNAIEVALFTNASITPDDISEKSTKSLQKELLNWEV